MSQPHRHLGVDIGLSGLIKWIRYPLVNSETAGLDVVTSVSAGSTGRSPTSYCGTVSCYWTHLCPVGTSRSFGWRGRSGNSTWNASASTAECGCAGLLTSALAGSGVTIRPSRP